MRLRAFNRYAVGATIAGTRTTWAAVFLLSVFYKIKELQVWRDIFLHSSYTSRCSILVDINGAYKEENIMVSQASKET